jgi:hypothetical protein
MTHYEAILNHIKADAPCSMNHVTRWAESQGFGGSEMIDALNAMKDDGTIKVLVEFDGNGVDIVVELN